MPGNSLGLMFRISTFGESHGGAVGVVVDGCPPGLALSEEDIQPELDRRKPGQSRITTPRKEQDQIQIYSGVFEGHTTGTPILIMARNKDARPEDYHHLKELYRPSHADYTYEMKYGRRDWRGSGRASARETLARVAGGAIAKKFLKEKLGVEILSYVQQVGSIQTHLEDSQIHAEAIEANIVRCPDPTVADEMIQFIEEVKEDGDSVGGVVRCIIRNVPVGLGEPVFDKLHADLAKAMTSINAVKGFEIGSGFAGVALRGSEHNDSYVKGKDGTIGTATNNAGGVLGGISTGEDIHFRVAFKPVATIAKAQTTMTRAGDSVMLKASGRHDPCVVPRAVPIVDAMAALVLMDHYLRHASQNRSV
ncbi:MAG: chorismate synthase [Deltaproteobacteria bacterium]|nr:MAG: chorismate synthase [Deltaproteobacteria bacterium]